MTGRRIIRRHMKASIAWYHLIQNLGKVEAFAAVMILLTSDLPKRWEWYTRNGDSHPEGVG